MSNVVTMSREDYYSNPAIGSSAAIMFIKDPQKFWHHFVKRPADPIVPTEEMQIGSMVDVLLTEGFEEFQQQFYTVPNKTRRGSKQWDLYESKSGGRVVVKSEMVAKAEACVEAVESNADAVRFLQTPAGIRQFSHVWKCPKTGLDLRGRLDSLVPDPYRLAGDLKVWSRSGEGVQRIEALAAERFVDVQAELYSRGIQDKFGWCPRVWALVVCDPDSKRVHVVEMGHSWFEWAAEALDNALRHIKLLMDLFRDDPRAWRTLDELSVPQIMPPSWRVYNEPKKVPTEGQIRDALKNLPEPNRPK